MEIRIAETATMERFVNIVCTEKAASIVAGSDGGHNGCLRMSSIIPMENTARIDLMLVDGWFEDVYPKMILDQSTPNVHYYMS